jgi:hypothetical protein
MMRGVVRNPTCGNRARIGRLKELPQLVICESGRPVKVPSYGTIAVAVTFGGL